MSRMDGALRTLRTIEQTAREDRWVNRIHPLVKLFVTILYIALVVSFHKYDLPGLLAMFIYPLAVFLVGELSFREALYRLRIVLPIVCVVGVVNPFFDRTSVAHIGGVAVTGGVLSMLTLMAKAAFAVLASYLLIATTTIEKICGALRQIRVPKIIVVELLLIYRYVTVLLAEVRRVTQAYALRAPGERGIAHRAWGSLIGRLLLRSMDRANLVYESMCLRGFAGDFPAARQRLSASDVIWGAAWAAVLLALRYTSVLELIGGAFIS